MPRIFRHDIRIEDTDQQISGEFKLQSASIQDSMYGNDDENRVYLWMVADTSSYKSIALHIPAAAAEELALAILMCLRENDNGG